MLKYAGVLLFAVQSFAQPIHFPPPQPSAIIVDAYVGIERADYFKACADVLGRPNTVYVMELRLVPDNGRAKIAATTQVKFATDGRGVGFAWQIVTPPPARRGWYWQVVLRNSGGGVEDWTDPAWEPIGQ